VRGENSEEERVFWQQLHVKLEEPHMDSHMLLK
jgi:hypothetical protein